MYARQCWLTVKVWNTDFSGEKYVVGTTANGKMVHGECRPPTPAVGWFECANLVELPPSPGGSYTFVTTASDAVRAW